jgi:hypothetical protein
LSSEATHLIIRPSLLSGCQEKPPTLLSGYPSYQVVKRSHPPYYQDVKRSHPPYYQGIPLIRMSREAPYLIIRPSLLSKLSREATHLIRLSREATHLKRDGLIIRWVDSLDGLIRGMV